MKRIYLVLILLSLIQCKVVEKRVVNARNETIYRGLSSTKNIIQTPNFPKSSDVSIFLENSVIQSNLNTLSGTKLTNEEEGDFEGWYCKIDSISLNSITGAYHTDMFVSIYNEKNELRGEIQLENSLIVSYASRDAQNNHLNIRVDLLPIAYHLKAKVGFLEIGTKKKSKFLADMLILISNNKLHTTIPISDKFEYDFQLAQNGTNQLYFNEEDESQGYVILETSSETHQTVKYLDFKAPAFLPNGLWLNFSLSDAPINVNAYVSDSINLDVKKLDETNERIRSEIETLIDDNTKIHPESSVAWLNKRLISSTFDEINNLDNSLRTINVNSIKSEGHIAKSVWESDISDGGYYAELTSDDIVRGKIELESIHHKWVANKGLDLSINISAEVKSNLHVHFDPYIGGGFGGQINLIGSSNKSIVGSITIDKEEINGINTLLLKTNVNCDNALVRLESNNEEFGSIGKLATVGIESEMTFADSYISPTLILSDIPMVVDLKKDDQNENLNIEYPSKFLVSKFIVKELTIDNEGLWLQIEDSIFSTNDTYYVNEIEQLNKSLENKLLNYYENLEKPCPKPKSLVGFVGPFEFGPNNEVIKVLAKLGADMSKLTGNARKEWDKFLQNPGDAIADMPENIIAASTKAIQDAHEERKRLEAKITKAKKKVDDHLTEKYQEAGKEATKAKKKIDNALTKARKKLLGDW